MGDPLLGEGTHFSYRGEGTKAKVTATEREIVIEVNGCKTSLTPLEARLLREDVRVALHLHDGIEDLTTAECIELWGGRPE